MIIHICGSSGSGKTYLGEKLKRKFKNKIVVKDLDELRQECKELYENKIPSISGKRFAEDYQEIYQKYIDDFIESNRKSNRKNNRIKPIIFVGLNAYIQGERFMFKSKKTNDNKLYNYPNRVYFDLHADYKFYIDITPEQNYRQFFNRDVDDHIEWFAQWVKYRKDTIYNNIMQNEKQAKKDLCMAFTRFFKYSDFKKRFIKWNKYYAKKGYTFMKADKIHNKVAKIIKNNA